MSNSGSARQLRVTLGVFLAAVVVSIAHYVDNVVRYERYVGLEPSLPQIDQPTIVVAWFVFTAAGVWGVTRLRAGARWQAAIGLGFYSISGLIGVLHFIDVPPARMDTFQLGNVIADFLLGVAMLAVAVWAAPATQETTPTQA